MALITKYPIDSTHAKLYRGDPWAIRYRISDQPDPEVAAEPRDLTGTFWRAHIRATENGALLGAWTVEIEGDQGVEDERGWLLLTCDQADTRFTVPSIMWDLEQVSDDDDDEATESLGTVWKVTRAPIIGDVSWVVAD